ncbi:MAG TPA: heme-binding protein [Chloroflexota bacterium]|nr:heme-binding protein [Chloroflexota bacterium]
MTRRGRGVLAIALAALLSGAASAWPGSTGLAAPQSQEVAPAAAVAEQPAAQGATAPVLTLAEARTIIEGATAFARARGLAMSVAVLDAGGTLISQDRMDGASILGVHGAQGKAMAALVLRRPTAETGDWPQNEPDRWFGLLNMFPGQVYLAPGGVPLRVNGVVVGAVGVSGLPRGVDDEAIEAGLAAWEQMRPGAGQ